MVYDFEINRPSTYRPRHYTSYTPIYYNSSYNTYTPWYRFPSSFTANVRRPYRYNFDYRYDIPDYKFRSYITTTPKIFSSVWNDADRHYFSRRLTNDIVDSRSNRASSVPRFTRASSLESDNDFYDTIFRARHAISRARMMSEEPTLYSRIKSF
ncbi:hypothetical protein HA402_011874 [Bradysia odoriphaga]|nr:hypothetical protein HA402_011874 [Bradysia odoriphaga]